MSRYETPVGSTVSPYRRFLPVVGLLFLAAAWIVFFEALRRGDELREKLGPGFEVYDALVRDHAVGLALRPYALAALSLDFLAFLIVFFAFAQNGFTKAITMLGLILVVSFGWHGFALIVFL